MAQASLAIRKTAQEAGSTSQTLARRATDDFRQTWTDAIRDPVRNADAMLQDSVRRANQSAERLERSMHMIRLASTANAWKTFVACTVASLTVIGGAAFAAVRAHQDIAVSAWVEQINTAVNAGRLARCPDGTGICALVKGSWVNLAR